MRIETEGLILKSADTGESDRLLTVLTREYGVLRAFANGAKKLKSRSLSATQPLCYARLSLYRSRDSYRVDEAQVTQSFYQLREDITALALAQYFCELAAYTAPQDADARDFLQLLLPALHLLARQKRPQPLLKAAVELRITCLAGYRPDLSACARCTHHGQTLPEDFVCLHLREGVLTCAQCARSFEAPGEKIGLGVLAAMRHICTVSPERLFQFRLPAPSLAVLERVSEAYLITQLEHRFATLDFYRRLAEST